jgi:pimeloyl-ACP methyl ester carboxylesterase
VRCSQHSVQLTSKFESVVQGGDLGSLISRFMAQTYGPKHCKAYHINSAIPAEPTAASHPELYAKIKSTSLSETELAGLGRTAEFFKEGDGYFKQQSSKPQTIGYSLADSPVGLLAWLYEKLHDWSDNYAWTDDEILTWVSIYYFSHAGPAASSNVYYALEHREPKAFQASQGYINIPLGIARFAADTVLLPKLWNQTMGPLVLESEFDKGGHFAAWERPDAIVRDLRNMFRVGGGAYSIIGATEGYET